MEDDYRANPAIDRYERVGIDDDEDQNELDDQ